MKRFLLIIAALATIPALIAVMAVYAGPPMVQGINTGAMGAISATSIGINSLVYWGSATDSADEDAITLPAITANYSGHGFVRVSAAGVIADSAEFESGSDGNVSIIRGTANIVVGAACADTKICISSGAAQNPIIVKPRNGAGKVEIEFWYK